MIPAQTSLASQWLPPLPKNWTVNKLGFVTRVKARLGWKGLKAEEYIEDGYIFLSTPNIKENEIDFRNVNYISEFRYFESPEIMLQEGDVLIAKDGSTLGTANVVRRLPRPSTVNSSIAVIRPFSASLNSIFLYYFLRSTFMQGVIRRMKGGMGVPHLFQADLRKFDVLLPPVEMQQAIAHFLDRETARIDELIAKKERLIDLLEERRRTTISEAVCRGLNGGASLRNSGSEWLGAVPVHWQVMDLKRVFESAEYGIGEGLEKDGCVAVLRMGNIQNEQIVFDDLSYLEEVDSKMLLRDGDILFNRTNSLAQIGKAALFKDSPLDAVSFAGYLVRLRCNPRMIPQYLIRLLNRPETLEKARSMALPSIGQANLNPSRYGYLKITVPPVEEQQKIATFAETATLHANALKRAASECIFKLREYRTALISAAVTGQIDIRTYRNQPEAVLETA